MCKKKDSSTTLQTEVTVDSAQIIAKSDSLKKKSVSNTDRLLYIGEKKLSHR